MTTETILTCGDYVITQEDSRNWRVNKRTDRPMKDRGGNEKEGQFIQEFVGYYDSLPACLRAILRDGYRDMGGNRGRWVEHDLHHVAVGMSHALDEVRFAQVELQLGNLLERSEQVAYLFDQLVIPRSSQHEDVEVLWGAPHEVISNCSASHDDLSERT